MKQTVKRTSIKNRKYTRKNKGGSFKPYSLMRAFGDEFTDTYISLKNRAKIGLSKRLGKLWTSSKLKSEKKNLKHIDQDSMIKKKKYYIEHKGCSFESGLFEDTFEEGIHTGAVFKDVKLLYKSSKPSCTDFPYSYTKPIYGKDHNTVVGRTGEIRLDSQYNFYEEKK